MEHNNFDHLIDRAYRSRREQAARDAQDRARQAQQEKAGAALREQHARRRAALQAEAVEHAAAIRTRAKQTAAFLVARRVDPTFTESYLSLSQKLHLRPRMAGWVALELSGVEDDNPSQPSGVNAVHYAEMCSSSPGQRYYSYPKIFLTTKGSLVTQEGYASFRETTTRELIVPHGANPSAAVPMWEDRFVKVVAGGSATMDEREWQEAIRRR